MTSFKTTALGIVTIGAAIFGALKAALEGGHIDIPTTVAAVTAGWGLIHAQDQLRD